MNQKSASLAAETVEQVPALSEENRAKYARKAVMASTVGYALDGFDMLILGFILIAIKDGLGLSDAEGGSLVTWTLFGAVIGGVGFGWLSDRYGRIRVLTWTILVFAGFTGMCALAQGYWDLVVYRTLAGLGLGGEFGIGMALAAEACRPQERARMSSYVGLGWQAGVLVAALVTPILLPHIGWRGMFAVGVLPAIASFFIRRYLDEPEIFERKSKEKHTENSFKALIADAKMTRASIGIAILTSVQNFGYFGIMIWMPSYLAKQFGYSLTKSAMWTSVTILGMAFGIWLFGQLADRYGRRPIFLLYQAGAAIMVFVYSQLTSEYQLLFGGAAMGMFVNGMLGGYGALMSEVYPTHARATAQNVLFNIGRVVGGFGPPIVGMIVAAYSFQTAIALLASLYVLDMIVTIFLIPEKVGQPLD